MKNNKKVKRFEDKSRMISCLIRFQVVLLLAGLTVMAAGSVFAQDYYYNRDYTFVFTPLGFTNHSGPGYAAALGMGGVSFSQSGVMAGFYNPAVIGLETKNEIFLGGSFSHAFTRLYALTEDGSEELRFKADSWKPEAGSLLFNIKKLRLAAGYGYFHNLSRPALSYSNYYPYTTELMNLSQEGNVHSLLLAASYPVSSKFAVGFSAGYVFGKVQSEFSRESDWLYGISREYNLKGIFYSVGLVFIPDERLRLGFSVRPAIHYRTEAVNTVSYFGGDTEGLNVKLLQEPTVFLAGILFMPVENLKLAADLSLWGWGGVPRTSFPWFYSSTELVEAPQTRENTVRLNLGSEYTVRISSGDSGDYLKIRAGYILDPGDLNSRQFLATGLGVQIGGIGLDLAAIVPLAPYLPDKVYSTVVNLGLSYNF